MRFFLPPRPHTMLSGEIERVHLSNIVEGGGEGEREGLNKCR